ncbi:MAG: hypothetical protein MPF33_08590 [Candidatus Aramenus sp.]|jgi:hypothetical protein|nr:hypothetical protein [Candidatus Aramenus sp.]
MFVALNEREFDDVITRFKELVYEYNSKIKEYNVYLKPFHVVNKGGKRYFYIGKYWYKLERINGKLKWIYLGKEKPIKEMPEPPRFPEVTIIKAENKYIVDDKIFKELRASVLSD